MKSLFFIFRYYYHLAGYRLVLLGFLMLLTAASEGLGLGLIWPLLQGFEGQGRAAQFFRQLINGIGLPYSLESVLGLIIITVTVRAFLLLGQEAVTGGIVMHLRIQLREKFISGIFSLDYEAYQSYTSGYLNNAAVRELDSIAAAFSRLAHLCVLGLMGAVSILLPLLINPGVVVTIGVLCAPLLFVMRKVVRKTKELSVRLADGYGDFQCLVVQALANFKYLKATGASKYVLEHIFLKNKEIGRLTFWQGLLNVAGRSGFDPVLAFILVGVVYYFVRVQGVALVSQLLILGLLLRGMKNFVGLQDEVRKLLMHWGGLQIVSRIQKEIEALSSDIEDHNGVLELPHKSTISLRHVSFRYHGDTKNAIQDVSFDIAPQSTVAFVGESGSGKSTLVNLIIGLLTPTSGDIFYGQRPLNQIPLALLRKRIGYITQENVIFHDTILNNISLWQYDDKSAGIAAASQCAKKAHIDEFIQSLDKKYEAVLGENGINLSGGQRQRICIARELYKDSSLLIFDEATSALDTNTELEIKNNINELRGEKTIIIIAHRLSTVKNADKIILLSHGCVVAQGTFDELYSVNKLFRRMVELQR